MTIIPRLSGIELYIRAFKSVKGFCEQEHVGSCETTCKFLNFMGENYGVMYNGLRQ